MPRALDIAVRETADRPTTRMNDEDFAAWSPGEAMLADRSGLSMDWLEIEDDGESFAALRALPVVEKQALFAACVARTVNPQLAFEPQARPELEATVARLDIDFAKHVRPTAAMLWSRIAKARILDIARTVFGVAWASARAKSRKPVLAEAMEAAFAAGDRRVSLSAGMHAAALAWTPPGFAAFDTGRIGDGADGAPEAEMQTEADTAATVDKPADPPRKTSVVESIESPDVAARRAEALAARANGDGRPAEAEPTEPAAASGTVEAAPEAEPSDGDVPESGNGHAGSAPEPDEAAAAPAPGADGDEPGDGQPEPPIADAIDAMNAVPTADGGPRLIVHGVGAANGHDAPPDPLEIPEFLRRVQ